MEPTELEATMFLWERRYWRLFENFIIRWEPGVGVRVSYSRPSRRPPLTIGGPPYAVAARSLTEAEILIDLHAEQICEYHEE